MSAMCWVPLETARQQGLLLAALPMGPLGNLRHDSALMGALTNTKGKQALPERVPVSPPPPPPRLLCLMLSKKVCLQHCTICTALSTTNLHVTLLGASQSGVTEPTQDAAGLQKVCLALHLATFCCVHLGSIGMNCEVFTLHVIWAVLDCMLTE